ncbi:Fnr1p [Perkinsus chesapeaki]|uniref:ferredoxin--NADP(+) reductase n=1 Tax=Perkinsus chesapeaki TaxID=330153 RepID=A0A7J6MQZ1_PERCH|nr:Fnr1p [Perkinsus chesapeaki]
MSIMALVGLVALGRVNKVTRRARKPKMISSRGRSVVANKHKLKKPLSAVCLSNTPATEEPKPNAEVRHIVLDTHGDLEYLEGQSIGIIPPQAKMRVPQMNIDIRERISCLEMVCICGGAGDWLIVRLPCQNVTFRLFMIALKLTMGDLQDGATVSLCVKRVVEVDKDHGEVEVAGPYAGHKDWSEGREDALRTTVKMIYYLHCITHLESVTTGSPWHVYRGIGSNFLCDLKPGDKVDITGPTGKELLLPEEEESKVLMLATGTGIAPFRGFLSSQFNNSSTNQKGKFWLILGVADRSSILYPKELEDYESGNPEHLRIDYALSREEKDDKGNKMYIQNKMRECGDEIWSWLQDPHFHLYMCGLKVCKVTKD